MHILKIIHGYPMNYNAGSEVYSQSICNELSQKNKITIFSREENPFEVDFSIRKETIENDIDLYLVNMAQGKDGYKHQELDLLFYDLVKKIAPNVAHIGHLNHLSTGIIDVLNQLNIPIVFTLHDFWLMCPRGQFLQRNTNGKDLWKLCDKQENKKCATSCYKPYFSGKENCKDDQKWTSWVNERMIETKSIINKVDQFIAPSKYLMDRFINDFDLPIEKIKYLDYGFPVSYLSPLPKTKTSKEFTFGYIGTHIPSKGINLLIEAFKKIQQPCRLKIFGRNNGQSTKALQKLAKNSPNTIEFLGEYINKNLATTIFTQVDAIVVPSIWGENSPLVIHEAQACHIPVITADFGGMSEYVHHKVNGLLFEHRNINSIYHQLSWAIDHQKEMKLLGEKGYLFTKNGQVPNIIDHCEILTKLYQSTLQHHESSTLENHY